MSNVRAEVLRVSRSRTGWKEPDHSKTNQRPCISSLKSTFETADTSPRSETPKGNGGGNDMFKPARPAGTKVSSIASMFQSMSPHKDENIQMRTSLVKTEPLRSESTHKKPVEPSDVVTSENLKNSSVRESNNHSVGVGNVHLARTESHLARFNNARAMFERLEEKNLTRVKSGCVGSLNLKKRSGSVSPSRSSPTRTSYSSNCTSRSPSPGEIQSVGSSPKKDSQLSPREKSWSADNILGVRNRDNSAVSKFYESSHINGARANMELNLELRESGAGEAIVSPSPLSPGLVNYLIGSPLDDDIVTTNGKSGLGDMLIESRGRNTYNKPLLPPHKPTVNAAAFAAKVSAVTKDVPKMDENIPSVKRGSLQKYSLSGDSSEKAQDETLNSGATAQSRPRIISSMPSILPTTKSSDDKSRSHIPQLVHKDTTRKTLEPGFTNDSNFGEQGGASLISATSNSPEIARQFTPAPPPPQPSLPSQVIANSQQRVGPNYISSDNSSSAPSPHHQLNSSTNIPTKTNGSHQNGLDNTKLDGSYQTASNGDILKDTVHKSEDEIANFTNGVSAFSQKQLLAAEEVNYKELLLEGLQETVVDPENGSDVGVPISDGMSKDIDKTSPHESQLWETTTPELPVDSADFKDDDSKSTGAGEERSSSSHSQRWSSGTEELPPSEGTPTTINDVNLKNVNSQGTSPLSPFNYLERDNKVSGYESNHMMSAAEEPEVMTVLEAEKLLSRRICSELLSDEEANEVKKLLKMKSEESNKVEVKAVQDEEDESEDSEDDEDVDPQEGTYEIEEGINYLEDGHFWVEVPGLPDSDEDNIDSYNAITMPKKRDRVRFSTQPMKVYSTFSITDYDRRNDEVDPVSASAEYELEKRVEKMDVFPIELMKGSEGLGLSIIGMGVGADAGLEKLGIFVKTITDGGAAHKDGRIKVNDQIIEVDGKSLVGVTQAYAASVLRNTAGLVRFLIGREKDGENSEVAQLISQSLMADRDREERRRSMELELQRQREEDPRGDGHAGLTLPIPSLALQLPTSTQITVQEDSTPEEGEDCPTCEVFDLEDDSSDSPSPDSDVTNLKIKLKEAQYKNAVAEAEAANTRVKLAMLESVQADHVGSEKRVQILLERLTDAEKIVESTKKEIMTYQDMLEESQGQYILLEKKYYKAKKLIKEFQLRQHDLLHREEYHLQQLQEKDQEYNALVKFLKDRVIQLEQDLTETQKMAGLPIRLPYDSNSIKQLQLTPQQLRKPQYDNQRRSSILDISDGECSDGDLTKYDISPISDDAENKTSTVERKPSTKDDVFEKAVPHTELLDNAPAKAKAELACKGSLANRQPPSLKKAGSTGSSSDGMSQDLRDSGSSLNSSHEDLECSEPNLGDKTSFSTSFSSDSSPPATPLPADSFSDNPRSEGEQIEKKSLKSDHNRTSPVVGNREGQGSPIRIDDRFAEQMRKILERKTIEVKSKISDLESDNLRTHSDINYGEESRRNLTPSPGSTTSTHSSDSNAASTVDLSHSPQHIPKSSSFIKIHDSSLIDKPSLSHDYESRLFTEGKNYNLSLGDHSGLPEKRAHQWHSCSVTDWSTAQVGQWLLALSMEQYISNFMDGNVGGKDLLQIDGTKLKILGVINSADRAIIKKKIKDLKSQVEKERKAIEKELRTREKLQRKADKAAEKASVKRK